MSESRLLQIRVEMEMLITEREAMLAFNAHRAMQGFAQGYGEEAFARVQVGLEHLATALREGA